MSKRKNVAKNKKATKKSIPTAFKQYCHTNNITQSKINAITHYSYRTIHHLWNGGTKINQSTIALIFLSFKHTLGLKVTEEEITKMLTPDVKSKK